MEKHGEVGMMKEIGKTEQQWKIEVSFGLVNVRFQQQKNENENYRR
jgi:hypothetical protein